MRYMTAMITQAETVDTKQAKKIVEYSILQMEKTYRNRDENGNYETSLEETMRLIPTNLLDKVIEKLRLSEIMPEITEKMEEYKIRKDEYDRQFRAKKLELLKSKNSENIHIIAKETVVEATISGNVTKQGIEENQIAEYKKVKWYEKIINKIKNILK